MDQLQGNENVENEKYCFLVGEVGEKPKMEPHAFSNTEKSWGVLWAAEGHEPTAVQRFLTTRFG